MDEANVLTLRGQAFTLGDLDSGIVEDEPEAVADFFQLTKELAAQEKPPPYLSGKGLTALLTLGAAAIRAGSDPAMTREKLRRLVPALEGIYLFVPVGRALGLEAAVAGGAPGEAGRPEKEPTGSPAPAPSSGA